MDQLQLVVRRPSLFSREREVWCGDKRLTTLKFQPFRGTADFTFEGERYKARSTGLLRRSHSLMRDGAVVTTLIQEGWFGRHYRFEGVSGLFYRLRSGFKLAHELVRDGRVVGSISSESLLSSSLVVDMPGDMPIPLVALLIYVTMLIRAQRAAAS